MKKLILTTVAALCVAGITCSFAADSRSPESLKEKGISVPQKAVTGKSEGGLIIKQAAPVTSDQIDPNMAKIAYAVLPKVAYPTMSHHINYDGQKFSITVRFNTDMDRNTVVAGHSVIFDFPKAANEPGQITWINDREFKWIQQSEKRFDICIYNPDCEFKLTLKDGILSKEGLKLDGDNDGKQGGDYTLWFIDIG